MFVLSSIEKAAGSTSLNVVAAVALAVDVDVVGNVVLGAVGVDVGVVPGISFRTDIVCSTEIKCS